MPGLQNHVRRLQPILQKYIASGEVKYVTKHYPLEPECNPYVPGGNHYGSCEAAASVLMAKAKGNVR